MVAIACVCARPQFIAPVAYSAYSAPFVAAAAPVATSAVVSREFHGNTASYLAALPYTAAYVASPYASAYTSSVLL